MGSLEPALDAGFEDLDLGLSAFASTWLFVFSTAPLPLAFSGDSFLFLACTPFGLKVLFLFPFVEADRISVNVGTLFPSGVLGMRLFNSAAVGKIPGRGRTGEPESEVRGEGDGGC